MGTAMWVGYGFMKVRVLSAADMPDALMKRWAAVQSSNQQLSSPFFRPEFTRAVASARQDVRIAEIDDGAAIFPFQLGKWGFGRPVGGVLSDYHGLISEPGAVYDIALLVQACGLRAWAFDHVPASQLTFVRWSSTVAASPLLDLTSGPPNISKEQLSQFARKRRKAEREIGPAQFDFHVTEPEMLERCIAWKSAQYERLGTADLFTLQWPRDVLHALTAYRNPGEFAAVMSVLRFGDRPVAAHFGVRAGATLHWWFPVYDPEFGAYSPGILLLIEIISAAAQNGVSVVDFGKGEMAYKQQFANGTVGLLEGVVTQHPWIPRLQQQRARVADFARSHVSDGPLGGIERMARKAYRSWRYR